MTVATSLDHLIVAADTLAQGVQWCEDTLGVTPGPGGRHERFGTHNRLLKIATAAFPNVYLEIIAIDPEAPPPAGPRWFGLDDAALQARLRQAPRLLHCVARSNQLDMHRWGLIQLGLAPGEPVAMHRDTPDGRLAWSLLIRPDGALLAGGALPTFLQWQGRHPAEGMADSGLSLKGLTLRGLAPRVAQVARLSGVQMLPVCEPGQGALSAVLDTPRGPVTLESA